jgi:hypothetical protein
MNFSPFDQSALPEPGAYWFAFERPEWAVVIDEQGYAVGDATGKIQQLVTLAQLVTFTDAGKLSHSILQIGTGLVAIDDDDLITAYAQVSPPTHPNLAEPGNGISGFVPVYPVYPTEPGLYWVALTSAASDSPCVSLIALAGYEAGSDSNVLYGQPVAIAHVGIAQIGPEDAITHYQALSIPTFPT